MSYLLLMLNNDDKIRADWLLTVPLVATVQSHYMTKVEHLTIRHEKSWRL